MRRAIAPAPHWPLIALAGLLAGSVISLSSSLPSAAWLLLPLPLAAWSRWRLSLLLALGLVLWVAWQHAVVLGARLPAADHGREYSLRGHIVAPPEQGAGVSRFLLESPDWPGGRLRLAWYRDAPALRAGDCWELQLRLREPRGSVNPGVLDYEAWLFRQRIIASGSVREGRPCGHAGGLAAWRQARAEALRDALGQGAAAATMAALVLGLRDGISDAQWEVLRRTGTSHLFAISGLHLGLIAALGFVLGRGLWRLAPQRWGGRALSWGAVLAASLAIAYAAIAGFGIPLQRALLMCLIGVYAMASGRWRDPLSVLCLAVIGVLLIDPLAISAPGFWLSFVATAGILAWCHWQPRRAWPRRLLELQLLLGLLLAPLSLGFFGGASLLALPVNLLLVPLFSLLLPLVLLAALLQPLPAGDPLLRGVAWLLERLWQGLSHVADWPLAFLQPAAAPPALLLLALSGVLLWLLPRACGARLPGLICLLPLLLHSPARPAPGELWVSVWDVGQGQSLLLQTAGHDLLYDAGPAWPGGFDAGRMIVLPALRHRGVDALAMLLLSHGDSDHAGGAASLRRALRPGREIGPGGEPCRAGQAWQWDGVRFELLHPDGPHWRGNDGSCVLRVSTAGGRRLLLPGDIERRAEAALLASEEALRADVLLVPHHGSDSSSHAAFLRAVAPQLAIASVGYRNRWGFPQAAVQRRYAQAGIPLWTTAGQGAIQLRLDSAVQWSGRRAESRRIWRYPPS